MLIHENHKKFKTNTQQYTHLYLVAIVLNVQLVAILIKNSKQK